MALQVGAAETNTQAATGRFVNQQGGFFINPPNEFKHTQSIMVGDSLSLPASADSQDITNLTFNPVGGVSTEGASQWFYTFQQCKLDKIEVIFYNPQTSAITNPSERRHFWIAPYNKPFNQASDLYVDPIYLPGCVYKMMTVQDKTAPFPGNAEMLRLSIDNPTLFIDETSGTDDRYASVATNQFWNTIFTGGVLSAPRFNGLILKHEAISRTDLPLITVPYAIRYTFTFEGVRMARGPSRTVPGVKLPNIIVTQVGKLTPTELNIKRKQDNEEDQRKRAKKYSGGGGDTPNIRILTIDKPRQRRLSDSDTD